MTPAGSPPRAATRLRFATAADTATILAFIRELAEYERLAEEAVADEPTLAAALFGERPYAEVVLAELDGEPVGFALFFHSFSTFLGRPGLYLEDLFVRRSARGRGVGVQLLAFLARLALERGCGRLEWSVLDWNAPAIRFYTGLGASAMDDWTVYRVTDTALEALAARFEIPPPTPAPPPKKRP
jgi:GNAT superfamily N-acetyltransferase